MNEQPDWGNEWGRAQNGIAIFFGIVTCIFLASVLGTIVYLVKGPAMGVFIGIGFLACLLRITFKDWND